MSNKLKTLSRKQLEDLISNAVGEYLDEDIDCEVERMSYESFNDENEVALENKRDVSFRISLAYQDKIIE
ncbi:MAG TPA: hypothetical protein VKA34_06495 [Balneolales bacterium]|nr:hypothetical protein [Balneolales bacterium]